MHDVFISYQHESKTIADNMVSVLESHRIRCWYAPRDVVGDYATSIVEAINSCKVFVLILNESSSESPHVLNEVEMAYKRIIKDEIAIVPFRLDEGQLSNAMEYYINRLHWIDAANSTIDAALEKLVAQLETLLPDRKASSEEQVAASQGTQRSSNRYFSIDNESELERLALQREILEDFDQEVYQRLLEGKTDLAVLDIGSNDGALLMDRLGRRAEVSRVLGIEYDQGAVDRANEQFSTATIEFARCDCETPELASVIEDYLARAGIQGFDFLNLSMVVLHLNKPYKVLHSVKKYLKPGAVVFVRDIDDQLNIAYPDTDGSFARINAICSYLETSGYRYSGRQLYSMLSKAGFKDIEIAKEGLSTIGMDHDQRSAFFSACFSFVPEDMDIMCHRYPSNEQIAADRDWLCDQYDDMEEAFQEDGFFYQEGFMIVTATC